MERLRAKESPKEVGVIIFSPQFACYREPRLNWDAALVAAAIISVWFPSQEVYIDIGSPSHFTAGKFRSSRFVSRNLYDLIWLSKLTTPPPSLSGKKRSIVHSAPFVYGTCLTPGCVRAYACDQAVAVSRSLVSCHFRFREA